MVTVEVSRLDKFQLPSDATPSMIHPVMSAEHQALLMRFEEHRIKTPDGFELGLFRKRPAEGERATASSPVLLLPGANSNRYTFGLNEIVSLPAVLSAQGKDVWILEFRGNKSSRYHGEGVPRIDIDAKLNLDLPTAIGAVKRLTSSDTLDLVGHSLGGVLIYLYLGLTPAASIGRAVTLCAPAHFSAFFGAAAALINPPARWLAPLAKRLPGLGIDKLLAMPGPLPHLVALSRHFQRKSVPSDQRRAYFNHAIEDLPGGDLSQLMEWVGKGTLSDADGHSYEGCFQNMRHPLLVIGAYHDRIAPIEAVKNAYKRCGSSEKRMIVLSQRHGSQADYAHQDLLITPSAIEDVFEPVAQWLDGGQ